MLLPFAWHVIFFTVSSAFAFVQRCSLSEDVAHDARVNGRNFACFENTHHCQGTDIARDHGNDHQLDKLTIGKEVCEARVGMIL